MMVEVPNWLAALPVMGITVILLVWSLELVSTSLLAATSAMEAVLDGALWLGLGLGALAIFFSGAISFVFMITPTETAPLWWTIGASITCVLVAVAMVLLTFQEIQDDE